MSRETTLPELVPVLSAGRHRNPRKGACFMEMASFLAGERWSDHPSCTHPLLASLARLVNDSLGDADRGRLVTLIPDVVGLTGTDLDLDLAIATRAAAAALPVAPSTRQNVLAVGLLTAQRLAADPTGGPRPRRRPVRGRVRRGAGCPRLGRALRPRCRGERAHLPPPDGSPHGRVCRRGPGRGLRPGRGRPAGRAPGAESSPTSPPASSASTPGGGPRPVALRWSRGGRFRGPVTTSSATSASRLTPSRHQVVPKRVAAPCSAHQLTAEQGVTPMTRRPAPPPPSGPTARAESACRVPARALRRRGSPARRPRVRRGPPARGTSPSTSAPPPWPTADRRRGAAGGPCGRRRRPAGRSAEHRPQRRPARRPGPRRRRRAAHLGDDRRHDRPGAPDRPGRGRRAVDATRSRPPATHGLAALHGSSPDVGIAGYSLGGGIGWYARQLGLATNSLTAVELVTADGEHRARRRRPQRRAVLGAARRRRQLRRGDRARVPAVRHRVGLRRHAASGTASCAEPVLRRWAQWAPGAPDEVTTSFRILNLPPIPDIPEMLRGRSLVVIDGAVLGSDEAGAAAIARPACALARRSTPSGGCRRGRWSGCTWTPRGPTPVVSDSAMLGALPDAAVDAFLSEVGPGSTSSLLLAELRQLGGALGREHEGAGALPKLDGEFVVFAGAMAMTPEMAAQGQHDAHRLTKALSPWANGRSYLNFAENAVDPRTGLRGADLVAAQGDSLRRRPARRVRRQPPHPAAGRERSRHRLTAARGAQVGMPRG